MKRLWKNNSLSMVLFGLFLLFWIVGQSWTGMRVYNADQLEHDESAVSYGEYLTTAHFGEATFENWESEFLQMGAFVVLTVWLRQKGSSESKPVDEETDVDKPSQRSWLYKNSLTLTFFAMFFASFALHLLTGAREYSNEQMAHGEAAVSALRYLRNAQFWFESFQNWQSEFLAVGSIVVLTIFLRQLGSPESKPVDMANAETPA
jgi:hypothetical protein